MTMAPIALFCFNRVEHLKRTVEALVRNPEAQQSELFIFSDGPRSETDLPGVNDVRAYIHTITGFRAIQRIERSKNMGLAASIIEGVSFILKSHETVIVMEDDLVTSPYFLNYMNQGLSLYRTDEKIASIHGYMYPVINPPADPFFLRGADCWGWATWSRAWKFMETDGQKLLDQLLQKNLHQAFDYNGAQAYTQMLRDQIQGKNNSWAIRWHASAFLREMLTLYPPQSLVMNIGFDGSGTHCSPSTSYDVLLSARPIVMKRIPLSENQSVRKGVEEYFRNCHQVPKAYGSKMKHFLAKVKRVSLKMFPEF